MIHHYRDTRPRPQSEANMTDDEIDLGKLFGVIWRGKLWIAVCGFLTLCLGGFYTFGIAIPVYTTTTSLVLENRQEQIVDIESIMSGISGDQVELNTELEILRSRRLIEKLVDDLLLVKDPEFNAELREKSAFALGNLRDFVLRSVLGQQPSPILKTDRAIKDDVIDEVLETITVSNIRQSYVFQISAISEDPQMAIQITNRLAELYVADQMTLKSE